MSNHGNETDMKTDKDISLITVYADAEICLVGFFVFF